MFRVVEEIEEEIEQFDFELRRRKELDNKADALVVADDAGFVFSIEESAD
jgi:hypothetical protein